jgi:hypothetical protein
LKTSVFQWAFLLGQSKNPKSNTENDMSELLQEYVDSRHERLRVDRTVGVIRGVKLLGLNSRNGRRYRETALTDAIGLYEGAKVNINHSKGHPLAPRDYQDRLGVVRGVEFRAGEGLFGDLHFNPKHALSEQLVWDAEHAPQNVGMSHNVLARTKREGEEVVVEAITKVQSIDLVADPATTSGLYEHAIVDANAVGTLDDTMPTSWEAITLEQLRRHRSDLVDQIERACGSQFEEVRHRLDDMIAREETTRRRGRILQLLQEYDLPLPSKDGIVDSCLVSDQFIESLMTAANDEVIRERIEERAALVRSAWNLRESHRTRDRRPRSRDQATVESMLDRGRGQTAAQFAASLRGA